MQINCQVSIPDVRSQKAQKSNRQVRKKWIKVFISFRLTEWCTTLLFGWMAKRSDEFTGNGVINIDFMYIYYNLSNWRARIVYRFEHRDSSFWNEFKSQTEHLGHHALFKSICTLRVWNLWSATVLVERFLLKVGHP